MECCMYGKIFVIVLIKDKKLLITLTVLKLDQILQEDKTGFLGLVICYLAISKGSFCIKRINNLTT